VAAQSPHEEGDAHDEHRDFDGAVGQVPRVFGSQEPHAVGLSVQRERSDKAQGTGEDSTHRAIGTQDGPGQRVTEHAGEDSVSVGTEDGAHEERFPQSTHAVFEGAHVVPHVLAPGEADANKGTENATLCGPLDQLTCSHNQREDAEAFARLLDDGSRQHGRHTVNGTFR